MSCNDIGLLSTIPIFLYVDFGEMYNISLLTDLPLLLSSSTDKYEMTFSEAGSKTTKPDLQRSRLNLRR